MIHESVSVTYKNLRQYIAIDSSRNQGNNKSEENEITLGGNTCLNSFRCI